MSRVWVALVRCPVCREKRPVRCYYASQEVAAAKRTCRECTDAAAVASGTRRRPYYGSGRVERRPATQPTDLPPGPLRVPVYEARAERGEQIFHPDDTRYL